MPRIVPAEYQLALVGLYRSWGIGTSHSTAQWEAFEQQLQKFQASVDQSGGPFLMGSEVSLVGLYQNHLALRLQSGFNSHPTLKCTHRSCKLDA